MVPSRRVSRFGVVVVVTALLLGAGARSAVAQGVFIFGDDSDDQGHCSESECGKLMGSILDSLYNGCPPLNPGSGILFIGGNPCDAPCAADLYCNCSGQDLTNTLARTALVGDDPLLNGLTGRLGWNDPVNGGPGLAIGSELGGSFFPPPRVTCEPDTVNFCNTLTCLAGVDFSSCRIVVIASTALQTPGGLVQQQLDALNARQDDLLTFVNDELGRLLVLTQSGMTNAYGFLPVPLVNAPLEEETAERTRDINGQVILDLEFPSAIRTTRDSPAGSPDGLSRCCYHDYFSGPAGFGGLRPLIQAPGVIIPDPNDPSRSIPAPMAVGACGAQLGNNPPDCEAGGPYVAECVGGRGAVILDGTASSDPDLDPLTYDWSTNCPNPAFDPGAASDVTELEIDGPPPCPVECTATLTVSDGSLFSSCDAAVRIEDTRAPTVTPPESPLLIECDCPGGLDATDPRIQAWLAEASATDACFGDLVPGNDAPAVFPSDLDPGAVTDVTFTATDLCGNEGSAASTVTIVTTPPPPMLRRNPDVIELDPPDPPKGPVAWAGVQLVGACEAAQPRLQDPIYDYEPIPSLPYTTCIEGEGTLGVPGSPLVFYEGAGIGCPTPDGIVLRARRIDCSDPQDGPLDLEISIAVE